MLIKNYWRQYIVWIGLVIALVPLFIIMRLQYKFLCELEQASTVSYKMAVKNYLKSVVSLIEEDYREQAEHSLKPLVDAFTSQSYSNNNTVDIKPWEGAKQLFVVTFDENGDSTTHFYNPITKLIETRSDTREKRSINTACTPWKLSSSFKNNAQVSHLLTVNELDPENRLILKPIFDSSGSIIGVAGLIIDIEHFKKCLKQALGESLPTVFPEQKNKMVITVRDSNKKLLVASCLKSRPIFEDDEVQVSLPFIFTDWMLGYQNYDMRLEDLAHKNFQINLTVSALMTLVLLSGIGITLRTIANEKKLSQMKTDFVSNVSHELRTPLSSIRVFGEFMRLGWVKDSSKVREYGEYIEAESRRLTQLIDNVLDFSRISSGHKIYKLEPASIENVIQATLKVFEVQQKQQGFNIQLELPNYKLPLMCIDENAIAQALINLIDNAIKYSGENKLVRVQLARTKEHVSVAVIDSGIGIAKNEQAKIFEKFYRVDIGCIHNGCVHDVKGNGLGLSIVKHVVEAHNGKVTLESALGKGSLFTIFLPVEST